jgi:hypothetical protein
MNKLITNRDVTVFFTNHYRDRIHRESKPINTKEVISLINRFINSKYTEIQKICSEFNVVVKDTYTNLNIPIKICRQNNNNIFIFIKTIMYKADFKTLDKIIYI